MVSIVVVAAVVFIVVDVRIGAFQVRVLGLRRETQTRFHAGHARKQTRQQKRTLPVSYSYAYYTIIDDTMSMCTPLRIA